jgi:hypothetical protein
MLLLLYLLLLLLLLYQRISELKKFRNKSKTITKTVTQKGEWISEQGQLQNMSYVCKIIYYI